MMLHASSNSSRRLLQTLATSTSSTPFTSTPHLTSTTSSCLITNINNNSTVRSYAKKDNREKKVSFKKQQQQKRELLAKQKREQLERKAEMEEKKRLEKEAKELARSQAKSGKSTTGAIDYARTKPKIKPLLSQIGRKPSPSYASPIKIVPPQGISGINTPQMQTGKWLHQFARVNLNNNNNNRANKTNDNEQQQNLNEQQQQQQQQPMFGLSIDGKNAPSFSADFGLFHTWITGAINITFSNAVEQVISTADNSPTSEPHLAALRVFDLKIEIVNALVLFAELHPNPQFSTYANSLLVKFNESWTALERDSQFIQAIQPFKSSTSTELASKKSLGQMELDQLVERASKLGFSVDSAEENRVHQQDLQSSIDALRQYLREYTKLRVAKPDTRLYELDTRKELINGQFNAEVNNVTIRKKVPGIEVHPTVAVDRNTSLFAQQLIDPTDNNSDTLKSLMTHVSNDGQRLYLWKTVRSALMENVDKELAEKNGSASGSGADESSGAAAGGGGKGKKGKDTNKRDSRFVQLNGVWNDLLNKVSLVAKNANSNYYVAAKQPNVSNMDTIVWLTELRSNILPLVQREQQLWNGLKRHRLIADPLVRRSIFRFQTKFERGNPDPKRNYDNILTAEVMTNPDGHTSTIPELSIQGWDVPHYRKLYADAYAAKYDPKVMSPFLNLGSALNACLKTIAQDIFGVQSFKFEECNASETWNPKYVKKIVLISDKGVRKTLYLDMAPPTQYSFNRHDALSFASGKNSAVLRLPFLFAKAKNQELPFGITRTLTPLELKNLCGEFMNACLFLFKNDLAGGDATWQSIAKEAAENFALDQSFLAQFEHESKGMPMPEDYVSDVIKRIALSDPKYGAHEVLSQIIYSIFDYQLFTGAAGSSAPMEMFRTLEQKLSVNDNVQLFDLNYFWNIDRQNPITSLLVKTRAQQVGTQNLKSFVQEGKSGFEGDASATSFEALVTRVGKELRN